MSLDVYLYEPWGEGEKPYASDCLFVFRDGAGREQLLSWEEWLSRRPNDRPTEIRYRESRKEVYSANITHNLNEMADKAGIYRALWYPKLAIGKGHERKFDRLMKTKKYGEAYDYEGSLPAVRAKEIVRLVEAGLQRLQSDPDYFKQFDAGNGWGTYEQFVPWVRKYLDALREHPEAEVEVSR